MVRPATELAVAGSVLQRLTYVGRADRRVGGPQSIGDEPGKVR
jgi:hypothetical protein